LDGQDGNVFKRLLGMIRENRGPACRAEAAIVASKSSAPAIATA
jgi:hypothetical protein